ncbi:CHAD domain-containing protein [Sphingobium aromaticiconvertens]|uniref:CYTH and CHAD domain-containing protein n=1 Tax=Sphingobium aromaticiconvertens TaxID=365341 RepID=UPI0030174071
MAIETELKLEIAPEAAAFLEASDLLSGSAHIVKQRAIYFDTPGKTLLSEGISLRIRREGRKRIQTIKIASGPAAGLFARSEWEMAVKNDEPVIDADGELAKLLGERASALAPAFEVLIERRTWMLQESESHIELVIDRGAAKVAGRESLVSEIELELKSGDPADLFSLARKLDAIVPVRLAMLSKAERGYGLLGPAVEARKAEPIPLDGEVIAAEAFRRIALSCLRQYRLNEAVLLEAWQSAALHQARVSLRRLRSAFTIFKPMLGGDRADKFNAALRDLSAVLGQARNLDVLRDRCTVEPLRRRIDEARVEAYARVKEELASDHVRALMLDLLQWIDGRHWLRERESVGIQSRAGRDFAGEALDQLHRRIKKHGRRLKAGTDEDRHKVRKDAKKLRYASDFFADFFDLPRQERKAAKFTKLLELLQEKLGTLNDHKTAQELIDSLDLHGQSGVVELLGESRREKLIKRADNAWEELIDLKRFWR